MAPSVRLGEVPVLKRCLSFRCFLVDSDEDDEEEESHSSREVLQL